MLSAAPAQNPVASSLLQIYFLITKPFCPGDSQIKLCPWRDTSDPSHDHLRSSVCKSKPGSIHSQRHLQKVNYPQIRRWLILCKCKPLASDRINCPLKATERRYSTKLKYNIQSLMSDEVTLICRVMLPTDLRSLIHLTQFTLISCSLQLSQWLTYSGLCYSLSSAWGPHTRHS